MYQTVLSGENDFERISLVFLCQCCCKYLNLNKNVESYMQKKKKICLGRDLNFYREKKKKNILAKFQERFL